jgi:hypothetical protein
MIEPTADDIGRAVIYTSNRYPGGKIEEGVITSFNHWQVFVRYAGEKYSKATSRADLEWAHPTLRELGGDMTLLTAESARDDVKELQRRLAYFERLYHAAAHGNRSAAKGLARLKRRCERLKEENERQAAEIERLRAALKIVKQCATYDQKDGAGELWCRLDQCNDLANDALEGAPAREGEDG